MIRNRKRKRNKLKKGGLAMEGLVKERKMR